MNATRIHALILSSLSVLAYAQLLPGLGNPVIIDNAPHYKGDPLDANLKIDKVLVVQGKPPAGWTPKFEFQVNVRENLPPAPQGCKWQTPVYTPPTGTTNVASGQAGLVQVKNVLVCDDKFCADAKNITVDLGKAVNWLRTPNGPPMTLVNPPQVGWAKPGTPPSGQFSSSGEWVGLDSSGSTGPSTYSAQIPFCLCAEPSTARAIVDDLRGDNQAKVSFDSSAPFVQTIDQYNFGPFRHAVNGSNGISGGPIPSNHALSTTVTNAPSTPTAFSMRGPLSINKGYLGACKSRLD